jgi:GMP synthase (glutamine-hydrolysing)
LKFGRIKNYPFYTNMILILDFGSQYTQLIARKVRSLHIYAEIIPFNAFDSIKDKKFTGIILSGGPSSVREKDAPLIDTAIFNQGIPVLGICYGMQLMSHLLGGVVAGINRKEYGRSDLSIISRSPLFSNLPENFRVWMSHGDSVKEMPPGFQKLATSGDCPISAMGNVEKNLYGVQFHPEVHHTENGVKILENFAKNICGEKGDWIMSAFVDKCIKNIREQTRGKNVMCGVSGGVDSTVLAILLHKAIGSRLKSVFVDNGLLRKNEAESVLQRFKDLGIPVKFIDASKQFLSNLKGITSPEEKRKIIGRDFVNVFFPEIKNGEFLAQGTLYPDVIESVSVRGPSATIKTHHNRVKEILELEKKGRLVEPLKELFKDEVRELGKELKIPHELLWRQPFPGPGLAVRHLGAVTPERLDILREADAILIEEIKAAGLYEKIWQSFCVLLPIRSVGVMGDERTYENAVAIRAVNSVDGMTADWAQIPYEILGRISNRIINEVNGINRVVYDISSKPPGTIEWE